jgi:NitT/TauT family transport system substrate-binding protein
MSDILAEGMPHAANRNYAVAAMRYLNVAILIFAILTFSCHKPQNPVRLNVRLGWELNANSAGQIVALEKGFYRDAGLDVTLNPGGLESPSVKTVAGGADDIGFANGPDLVINARAAGAPLKIVAVIQQESYHGFFVKDSSPIRTPKDWEGKTMGVKYASPTFILYQVILNKLGVDRSKIKEVPLKYGLEPFLEDKIDIYPGAFTNEAISVRLMGVKIREFHPSDYGIETCGNVIFTTEKMINDRPDVLRKFVEATLKGWAWCLRPENQEKTLDYLQQHTEHLQREKEKLSLQANIDLVNPPNKHIPYIGYIDSTKFVDIIDYMEKFGVFKDGIRFNDICTAQFLPTVSSHKPD